MTDKTDIELMQQALEALEVLTDNYDKNAVGIEIDAIISLRARLARPDPLQRLTDVQQALEALEFFADTAICSADTKMAEEGIAALRAAYIGANLYTAPQKREWQGAFFDAVYEAWHSAGMDVLGGDWNTFASTLEAKLKEKND